MVLILMILQVFAPWVHAHTLPEFSGPLHIPGLEQFHAPDGASGSECFADSRLVSLETGLRKGFQKDLVPDSSPDESTDSLRASLDIRRTFIRIHWQYTPPPYPKDSVHLGTSPRGPPPLARQSL